MNSNSDVDDSESIHKCPKSIFYMLIDNVILTERKKRNSEVQKCSARTVDGMVLCKAGCLLANVTFQLTCHISFICLQKHTASRCIENRFGIESLTSESESNGNRIES